MKVLIAGSSGFIGEAARKAFHKEGWEVVSLVRKKNQKGIFWAPEKGLVDSYSLSGFQVVLNLAGESIFGVWTPAKIRRMRESRIQTTRVLCKALSSLNTPPSLYLGASAVGYYGDRGEEMVTEKMGAGRGILPSICKEWEKIPGDYLTETRIALMRFGIVLGSDGALANIEKIFKWTGGITFGTGNQWFPWIALDDVIQGMLWIYSHPSLKGPINFVAPELVHQKEWVKKISHQLRRPSFLRIPAPLIKVLMGKGAEIFLASAPVIPEKFIDSGFSFSFPDLEEVLKKYLRINKRR